MCPPTFPSPIATALYSVNTEDKPKMRYLEYEAKLKSIGSTYWFRFPMLGNEIPAEGVKHLLNEYTLILDKKIQAKIDRLKQA